MSRAMMFDSTRCVGCGACTAACKEANGLPLPIEERTTAYTWTTVEKVNGALANVEFDTIPMVKDPWKVINKK